MIFAATLPFMALTAVTLWLVYRIGGSLPAVLFATHWIPLAFGSTTYPRTLGACCVVAALGADPSIRIVVLSQMWAYGDRLYLGDRMQVRDIGTPPRDLDLALDSAGAAALWEADLRDRAVVAALYRHGFASAGTYRDGPARAVVVFRRR